MLDLQHLPKGADVQIFTSSQAPSPLRYVTWARPRGKTMAYMLCIGAGGPGGNGFAGTAGSSGGGGGGSSGNVSSLLIPLQFLPGRLCIYVTPLNDASINIEPDTVNIENPKILWALGGSAGGNGTAGAGGPGGSAPGPNTFGSGSASPIAGLGKTTFTRGIIGANGGVNAAGVTVTYPTTGLIVTPGAGGGGTQASVGSAGGDVTGFAPLAATSVGGAAGTSGVDGAAGGNGLSYLAQLRVFTGGSGGGSSFPVATASNGGNGGAGGFGCGGGGGGAGVTGKTAGSGGRAGDALAIIICW